MARGVLRQAVPQWLSDPEFASIVVSFSQAPRRLGGEGALYVRLRGAKCPTPDMDGLDPAITFWLGSRKLVDARHEGRRRSALSNATE